MGAVAFRGGDDESPRARASEDVLRWHCYFFGVDLGTIEVIPSLGDVFSSGPVSSIVNRRLPTQISDPQTVNAPDARPEPETNDTGTA